jgi:hypothetical protein
MRIAGEFIRPSDLSGDVETVVAAIVTATILPIDGVYEIFTLRFRRTHRWDRDSLAGIPHFMGHQSTRRILERLGSIKSEANMYRGQEIGDVVISVSIRPGAHPRRYLGKTAEAIVSMDDLQWRRITRRA